MTGRAEADVAAAVDDFRSLGVAVTGIAADLARLEEAHRLGAEAIRLADRLDILINNAGMSIRQDFWEVSDDDWEYQVNVNLRSPFVLAQHAARHMLRHSIRGRIVNTGTIGARRCHKDAAVYDAAKAAVEAMTRNMAYELGGAGITVNCVVPGPIAERPGAPERPAMWAAISPFVPAGRLGVAADIANAVRFFCLPDSSFITGQSLVVDGGYGDPLAENFL